MAQPLVSVIIPSWQHVRYIRECIESIMQQSYDPIELLVIDDASTDGTLQMAERLRPQCEKRFVRTVMLSKEKGNMAASCNMGIGMAQGKYVYLIASDDAAEPDAIRELVAVLESRQDCVLAVGDSAFMDEASVRVGWDADQNCVPLEEARFKTFGDVLELNAPGPKRTGFGSYRSLLQGNYIPNGYLMRRSALLAAGGYNTSVLLEDWHMNLQLAKQGGMVYLPKILFRYRWHSGNTIKKYRDEATQTAIFRQIYDLEIPYCREHGLFSFIRRRHPDYLRQRMHRVRRQILSRINRVLYINIHKRKVCILGREVHF